MKQNYIWNEYWNLWILNLLYHIERFCNLLLKIIKKFNLIQHESGDILSQMIIWGCVTCVVLHLFSLFWARCGRGGIRTPTPWFVATCFNFLSYKPHSVFTWFILVRILKKKNLSSPQPFRVKKMWMRLCLYKNGTVRSEMSSGRGGMS